MDAITSRESRKCKRVAVWRVAVVPYGVRQKKHNSQKTLSKDFV